MPSIRAASHDDVDALVELFAQWGHPQPADVIAERLDEWAATPHAAVLVAEADGRVAGVAAVSASPHFARPGRFARLAGLVVDEAHRRRGVARALMRAVEEQARAWDCTNVALSSSRYRDAAHPFYEALGYVEQSARQARYLRELD